MTPSLHLTPDVSPADLRRKREYQRDWVRNKRATNPAYAEAERGRHRADREQRRDAGTCTMCGAMPADPGKTKCAECLWDQSVYDSYRMR